MRMTGRLLLWMLMVTGLLVSPALAIEPWEENRWYWSHDGEPVLLLGGSDDDNLFQWPAEELLPQLDRIAAAGGNVIRNTMSDRPDRGTEVYPFLRRADGNYDLSQWNPEYWERFERLLSETARRKIFIQIEIWDRFDYTDHRGADRWQVHPYNPANNVNYTYEESGFGKRYPDHPGQNRQPFFFTTPDQRNTRVVLRYQQAFVRKLLAHSLKYDHVLYCIDNETSGEEAWSTYWAEFLKEEAARAGRRVYVTEMWDDWNLRAERHRRTFDHPERYDFVDVSQNNHNRGQTHWDNFLHVRNLLASHPRPINTTKTYGADGNKFGHTDQDAIERFWRHLLAGAASMRFHRPESGLGINDRAVACLQAARALEASIPLWEVEPAGDLLEDREENEAYIAASAERDAIAVFFPKGKERGSVTVDLSDAPAELTMQWIDIDRGTTGEVMPLAGGRRVRLSAPENGNHVAAIRAAN